MIDIITLAMIVIYLSLIMIPLIYNYTSFKAKNMGATIKPEKTINYPKIPPKTNIIILLGEIDINKLEDIMRLVKKTNSERN